MRVADPRLVFQALALLHLGQGREAEDSYSKAIQVDPEQVLAWQGLVRVYETLSLWEKLSVALEELADVTRKQYVHPIHPETISKSVPMPWAVSSKSSASMERVKRCVCFANPQLIHTLLLFVPTSRFYETLLQLPAPDQTQGQDNSGTFVAQMLMHGASLNNTMELIKLVEERDEDEIESLIHKQKGSLDTARLGAAGIKGQVVAQVLTRSPLADLYDFVLQHPYASDEVRRETEAKQLRFYHRITLSMPAHGPHADEILQGQLRSKTLDLAKGMVVLGIQDELAWRIFLEGTDARLDTLPFDTLCRYVQLFPRTGRACAFRALLRLVQDEAYMTALRDAPPERVAEETDLLQLSLDGVEQSKESALCLRINALFYILDRDYSSALDVLEQARKLVLDRKVSLGATLVAAQRELSVHLAVCYTHVYPPKHHKVALELANQVLRQEPYQIDAVLARSYIDAQRGMWTEALQGFRQVMAQPLATGVVHGRCLSALYLSPDHHLEAEAEAARMLLELGKYDDARQSFEQLLERCDTDSNVFGSEFRARLWHQLGRCFWAMDGEFCTSPEYAYRCFIESIKRLGTYAPAFTSLGQYYEEAISPSDIVRSSKCFQRAFELDAREYEAARRLVQHFSEQREWGLVDVIARRVVEAEGGADVLTGKASTVHVTQNPWVWKAIGVVESTQGHPDAAVAAFQVALRASSQDVDAWVRLGEAYVESGRPVAALKTYDHALHLLRKTNKDESHFWHIYYDVAEAQRRLGRFDCAIELLERVRRLSPQQYGVQVVLAEARLAHARHLLTSGYSLRALQALHTAIHDAAAALDKDHYFRTAWKVVADACFLLSKIDVVGLATDVSLASTLQDLTLILGQQDLDNRLPAVQVVRASSMSRHMIEDREPYPHEYLEYAALFYKYLALVHAMDAQASILAWADLATALCRLWWVWPLPATVARHETPDLAHAEARAEKARTQAVECTRVALATKPHARLWLLMGNLHFSHDVAMAQHAYIHAIEANGKSSVPWTNLGFLYLQAGDLALAEEAFVRAQTIDPEWPASWLGSALVHRMHQGDARVFTRLFEQAFVLSDGALLEADYGFALAMFQRVKAGTPFASVRMMEPLLALHHYMTRLPHDETVLHLSALLAEQMGGAALAAQRIERAATLLETEYEATESASSALRYGLANLNLGRIHLLHGAADVAVDALEAAQALLDEDTDGAEHVAAARLWCAVMLAHAQFMTGNHDVGIESLQEVVQLLPASGLPPAMTSSVHACAAVLLARMRWQCHRPVEEIAQDLDHAYVFPTDRSLSMVPQDPLLITTRVAMAAVAGDTMQYNSLLAKHVAPLPPSQQTALRNSPKTALLSLLHLAATFDRPTLLQYLANSYTRTDNTTDILVQVAHTFVRVAAGCVCRGEPLPVLPLPEHRDGSVLAVARHVLRTVEARADEEGASHWAAAHWSLALAESLTHQHGPVPTEADASGEELNVERTAPPALASRKNAYRHAAQAVHLAPWEAVYRRTLAATRD